MKEQFYEDLLSRKGLKNTKHRLEVLMILDEAKEPMTAEQIFLDMKTGDSSISLSTVYRMMEILARKALVTRTNFMGDNCFRYEINRMEHKHRLICTQCNKMISVKGCPIENYERSLYDETGFRATGHRLEIYGVCSDCRKQKK